jgi:hypothetical protein
MRFDTPRRTTSGSTRAARRDRSSLGRRLSGEHLEQRTFLFAASVVEVPSIAPADVWAASPFDTAGASGFSSPVTAAAPAELMPQNSGELLNSAVDSSDASIWQSTPDQHSSGLVAEGEYSGDVISPTPTVIPSSPKTDSQSVVANSDASRFDWLLGSSSSGLHAEGEANVSATISGLNQLISTPQTHSEPSASQLAAVSPAWAAQSVDLAIQLLSVQQSRAYASDGETDEQRLFGVELGGAASLVAGSTDFEWDGWLKPRAGAEMSGLDLEYRGLEAETAAARRSLPKLSGLQQSALAAWANELDIPSLRISLKLQSDARPVAHSKPMGLTEQFVTRLWGGSERQAASEGEEVALAADNCKAGQVELATERAAAAGDLAAGRQSSQPLDDAFTTGSSSVRSMYREFDLAGFEPGGVATQPDQPLVSTVSTARPASVVDDLAEVAEASAVPSGGASDAAEFSGDSAWLPVGLLTVSGLLVTSRRRHSQLSLGGDEPTGIRRAK